MITEPAGLADVPAVVALVNGAYRGERAARGWTHEAGMLEGQRTDEASVRALIETPGAALLLRREAPAGALVGCVAVEPTDEAAWLTGMLTVDPARQAGGLGKSLLEAAEAYAAARGARRMEMTVIASRAALIAYYERRGYRLTGHTKPFPYEDERFGRPLRDDLYFVVLEKPLESAASPRP